MKALCTEQPLECPVKRFRGLLSHDRMLGSTLAHLGRDKMPEKRILLYSVPFVAHW